MLFEKSSQELEWAWGWIYQLGRGFGLISIPQEDLPVKGRGWAYLEEYWKKFKANGSQWSWLDILAEVTKGVGKYSKRFLVKQLGQSDHLTPGRYLGKLNLKGGVCKPRAIWGGIFAVFFFSHRGLDIRWVPQGCVALE